MIFEQKQLQLKDGRIAILKTPKAEDAEKLLRYIKQSCSETNFLARYPEEWTISVEKEIAWVNRLRNSPDALAISCYIDGDVVGNCEINFKSGLKASHRATVAIAVLQTCWGQGIGSAMFNEMIEAAEKRGTEIVELGVIEGNERAMGLYKKFGFRAVAVWPNAFKLKEGTYQNEIIMQRYL